MNAEECMLKVLDSKETLSDEYFVSTLNNLGVINNLLGRYQVSLHYYDEAENLIRDKKQFLRKLAIIYSNKARIYNIQKLYPRAIEYLEKGLRIYSGIQPQDTGIHNSISIVFQNLGIAFSGMKDYKTALIYFKKCTALKKRYNLTMLGLSYLNIANTLYRTDNLLEAEKFYIKSISEFENRSVVEYQRIADTFFDYGLFLEKTGREKEAFKFYTKALDICLKNFGKKHPYVSLAYKHIGDHYLNQSDPYSALQYYQKALIALVRNFDNSDINTNPPMDSVLLDLDLLKILQKKSQGLEGLALQQKDPEFSRQFMTGSLESIELALKLISRIRNNYLSEESRLYLMDKEKETYISAAHINRKLYAQTGDPDYLQNMYAVAKQAKSAVLHNEITDNDLLYSIGLPDTLIQKHNRILEVIAAYNNLIHEELQNTNPDNNKINFWKDVLFSMNREKERMEEDINKKFPEYQELLRKTEPISIEEIQSNLEEDETLVEYLLSNEYTEGKRALYIFTVTKDSLYCQEAFLDSLFVKNVETIRNINPQILSSSDQLINYRKYTTALFNMYDELIRPAEKNITGSRLIIIPDEEIAYLPFDAFIMNKPDLDKINYEGLHYLINNYTFSYGFSSSLIFKRGRHKIRGIKIDAFAPDYRISYDDPEKAMSDLSGTRTEIRSIYKWFNGKEFLGIQATERNFKSVIKNPVILHLAMHSNSDTSNSKFSCLIFYNQGDTVEDGNLYDYEISLSRINSPLVVLSACNTGTGTLFHGEGVMSLARAFILAGASSVIKTLWDVNDETSGKIITSFYYYLAKGKDKDLALRLAKLNYLSSSYPTYTNPYYWAAYQVIGDKSPVKNSNKTILYFGFLLGIILIGAIWMAYFKRRKSSFA